MSTTATATAAARKPKWHPTPPPPPSPKILNLPRRNRHRKQPKKPTRKPPSTASSGNLKLHHHLPDFQRDFYYYCSNERKGKLERLFGEDREFSRSERSTTVPIVLLNSSSSGSASVSAASGGGRRERVEDEVEEEAECGGDVGGILEEKWKFQAEILRAECNFLRKEKELAFKRLERNRKRMEKTLHSAVQTLISGKTKVFDGKNTNVVLEKEIENLIQKLEELQRGSGNKDVEIKKCSNFDKQATALQQRLEKLEGISEDQCVEVLSMKMEGLSKEMHDRVEEDCGSILSTTANSSVASSASTSKRIEFPEPMSSTPQLCEREPQEPLLFEDTKCSGRCKAIVRKIVEQVRAETEQWSQMQAMLGKVREEMQELQASRDFWEQRALNSENEIQGLQSAVKDWKEKALSFETKANKLLKEFSAAKGEVQRLRTAECIEPRRGLIDPQSSGLVAQSKRLEVEKRKETYRIDVKTCDEEAKRSTELTSEVKPSVKAQPISLGKQLEKEKRMLLRELKEKHRRNANASQRDVLADQRPKSYMSNERLGIRSPFRDIGNLSPLME